MKNKKMNNKKMNNKGFSLVELIVVIAIMAILAVTLAPKLTQYIEKARVESDHQAINTLFTTAQIVSAEHPLAKNTTITLESTGTSSFYSVAATGKRTNWTLNTAYSYTANTDFGDAFIDSLSNFSLKSSDVSNTTTITLHTDATTGFLTVGLDYTPVTDDSSTTGVDESADDYIAAE